MLVDTGVIRRRPACYRRASNVTVQLEEIRRVRLDLEQRARRPVIAALDTLELDLLAVLAGANEPISRTQWLSSCAAAGLRIQPSRAMTGAELEARAKRLLELELVTMERASSGTKWSVPGPIALLAFEESHARKRLLRLFPPRTRARVGIFDTRKCTTELRVALLCGDRARAREAMVWVHPEQMGPWLVIALGFRPPDRFLDLLDEAPRALYLAQLLEVSKYALLPVSEDLLERALRSDAPALRLAAGRILALRGDARAEAVRDLPKWGAEGLAVLTAFCRGDYAKAADLGDAAIAAMKSRKRKCLPDLEGFAHVLSSLVATSPTRAAGLGDVLAHARRRSSVDPEVSALHAVWSALVGRPIERRARSDDPEATSTWLVALVGLLHDVWLQIAEPPRRRGPPANELAALWSVVADSGGYPPLAREFAAIASVLRGEPAADALAGSFRAPAPWEAALDGLEALAGATSVLPEVRADELFWEVEVRGWGVQITPRLRGPKSGRGRVVALSRLLGGGEDDRIDEADRRVLAAAEVEHYDWRPRPVLGLHALLALVGHPRAVDPTGAPLCVVRGQPELVARTRGDVTTVSLVPAALQNAAIVATTEKGSVVVYERTPQLLRVTEYLQHGKLQVPQAGRDRLARALARVAAGTGLRIAGDLDVGIARVAADPRPVLLLGWDGERLVARVRVAPLGLSGPHLLAGVGAEDLVAELEGGVLARCVRDLAAEQAQLRALREAAPTLSGFADRDGTVNVPTLSDALEILLELDALGERIVLAWPEGRRLAVPQLRDLDDLRLTVGSGAHWIGIAAGLVVDEKRVLDFRSLLAACQGSRFVAIGRDRFLALSDRLRRRIEALANLGEVDADGVQASPVLLPIVEELAADLEHASFDDAALQRLRVLRGLASASPRLPRGFGATLRDYQREGFAWLWRLAEAGLGACLADDMGLGKTIQALALLVRRAALGPALVVCPTSVAANWVAEAARFAPSLRVSTLATASDRAALLSGLGARDVVVCSYAIATLAIDALETVTFATCVFDEAHALKNDDTQRTKAARRIRAQFRVGLTGTPVENRTTELWSLFSVLLPGLLGSRAHFGDRFAGPIASGHRERASQLRAMLRPFVLRRTKSQVLDELPPRTDVTLRISPDAEERSFYEAMRRTALERLAAAPPKKKRMLVLAEITKLRQAAVDPRIVAAAAPSGAKLDALMVRLQDLREEGHRALVFTQFLGAMAAVRERLSQAGIESFDLDGSTPAAERARRIEAFQAGERDVFLLSLRAGGLGVNLTGADYVFHLDPWWNPAVEDQASDRAHRIGQTRPVTVYRLVTEGTIEEKILALHEEKRDLADRLLSGLSRAQALDLEELVALLRG